ncbi:uncharacterized protein SOCG_03960 [Schizosaccharomyces octosporus yFS286]|uniref:Fungal protein n=1 Tax=Schizosaccharomyces octosporus (strain yFS286) TaxID=483514 RepID=S9PVM0_SCHOY|nr:uncharacterized protein SOCG_03960 [Schizosaccharomyces octosporus yFS286]EPX72027.1 fungal protein [Schizosaccharomyces octosporus yFS286]
MTSVNNTSLPSPDGAELTGLHSDSQQTATTISNKSLKGHYGSHPHQDHPSAYVAAKTGFTSRTVPADLRYDQSNQVSQNGNDLSTVSNRPNQSRFQYVAAGANRAAGHRSGGFENPSADSNSIHTSGSYGYHPHPHAGKAAQSAHVIKHTDMSEGRPNENGYGHDEQRKPLQFPTNPVFAGSAQQPIGTDPHSSNEFDEDSSRKVRLASQLAKHSATYAHQAPEPESASDPALPHRMAASQLVHNLSVQGSSSLEPQESSREAPSSANANSLAAASYAASHAKYDKSQPNVEQSTSPKGDDEYQRVRNMNLISPSGDNFLRDHTGQEDNGDAFAGFSRSDLLNNAPGYQGSRASTYGNTKNAGSERPVKPIYYAPGSTTISNQHQQKPKEGPTYDFSAASAALRRHRSMNANTSRNDNFESQEDARTRDWIRQMRLPTRSTIATNDYRQEPSYSNNVDRDQIQDEAIKRVRDMNLDLSKIQNRTDSQIRAYRPRSSHHPAYSYAGTDQYSRDADNAYVPQNQGRYSQANPVSYIDGRSSWNDEDSYGASPVEVRGAAHQGFSRPSTVVGSVPGRGGVSSNDADVEALQKRLSRAYIDHEREETYAIDLGAGRLISPEELEAIARRNVDPMVSELAERAAAENQRKQQASDSKAAKKQAKEEKKQRKRDEKARKAEEKRLAKERAKFAKQMSKDAGRTDEVAAAPITDHEQETSTSSAESYDGQEQGDQSFDPAAQEYLIQQTDIQNAAKQQELSGSGREAEEDVYQPRDTGYSGVVDHNLGVPSHYLHDEEYGGALNEGGGNQVDYAERSHFPTPTDHADQGNGLQETTDTVPRASAPEQYADLNHYPVVQETTILPDGQGGFVFPNDDESAAVNGYNDSEYKSDSLQKNEDDLDENDKVFNKASPKSPVAWLRKKFKNQKDKAAVKRMLEEDSYKKQASDGKVHGDGLQDNKPLATNGFTKHEQRPQAVETHYEPGLVTEKTGDEVPDLVAAQPHAKISSIPRTNSNLGELLDGSYVSKTDAVPGGLGDFESKNEKAVNGSGQVINHFPEPSKDPIGAAFHEDL